MKAEPALSGNPAPKPFEYDLSFSCLQVDEGIVSALNERLSPRLTTFFYPERQKELLASDGVEKLSNVFGRDSRVVAVIYRAEWGDTKWTRIEETAIKTRGFEEGFAFLAIVPARAPTPRPPWYPHHNIWFDFERWGVEGAAAALEALVARQGATPKTETLSERAARMSRARELAAERQHFLRSDDGVTAARAEFLTLAELLETAAAEVTAQGMKVVYSRHGEPLGPVCAIRGFGFGVVITQQILYRNSMDNSVTTLAVWKGQPPGLRLFSFEKPTRITELEYHFDRDDSGRFVWREANGPRFLSSRQLAEHALSLLLDRAQG